ncbi:MAG: class C sortase [Bifidobacterium sp.]|nr:class C sortase [Bifidobacterium sp.]
MSKRKKAQTTAPAKGEWTPKSFAEATDIRDVVRLRRSLRRRVITMRVVIIVLTLAALIVGLTPFALQWNTSRQYSSQTKSVAHTVAGWPYPRAEEELKAAREYNKRLAASGQPIIGEASDPFASTGGSSQASDADASASSKDEEYQSLLDTGNGVMGAIKIPQIGVDLPIYHGASEEALEKGAGHLYGSSLPVGGESTHAVITGHRGMVAAPMFTRIDELKEGDSFYVDIMGEELGYVVDSIAVIEPDDTSKLRIVPGEDRITLMTCTPYGVNTHRLLVSAHRVAIPHVIPPSSEVHDAMGIGILAALCVLIPGMIWAIIAARRRPGRIHMRHAAKYDKMRDIH